jgi:hypothetical protein
VQLTSRSDDQPAAPELTEALIAAAMAKVEARVCVGSAHCYAFSVRLQVNA